MYKSFIKILSILLIISLNWTGLSAVLNTFAYFNDSETSSGNIYSAGTLDFRLTNTAIEEFIGVELGEDIEFFSVATKMTGSMDIQYKAYAEKISGNVDFCNALQLESFHSVISYDGALLSFDTATTTKLGTWAFEIKLPHTAGNFSHGEECNVDLVFKGWRSDVVSFEESGFTDEERIELRLTSRMIVLNEFLPRPSGVAYGFDFGNDSSNMPQGEWVELYNNSDYVFDLSGWYIKDNLESDTNKIMITASNTAPAGTVIGSKSWLVVYMNKAVLNNDGDTVRLFDNSNTLIDSYVYTSHRYCELEPTPGDENSDTTGAGTCEQVPPNKSYARIPDGIGYWEDPIPTPGTANVLEGEEITEEAPIVESLAPEAVAEEPVIEEPALEEQIIETEEATTTEEEITTTTEEIAEEPVTEEEPIVEEEPAAEEVITEENQERGIIEEINEIIDEVIEEIIDEIMPDEETGDEVVLEPEVPVIEDALIIEEAPADEAPGIEEQPVTVPDDSSSIQDEPAESDSGGGSGDGGGDTGGSLDTGESSGESGDAGDSVSE